MVGRTVGYTRLAARVLTRMPPRTEALIREKPCLLPEGTEALANNIEVLKGTEGYRLRVGDWRVIVTIEPDRIMVHDIGPHGSIYG